ncbi:MAG: hypothetical protein CM1200mP10_08150 [Candidatus Neomarinimicrobiota bacterium]|nr:MAG: hypothetical protein CM1200mP10_08150 [Candidatus Neomarinimicrobiota bacterium]
MGFDQFIKRLSEEWAEYTPEFAAQEAQIDPEQIVRVARLVGKAGSKLSSHVWRGASIGNLGGWQVAPDTAFTQCSHRFCGNGRGNFTKCLE